MGMGCKKNREKQQDLWVESSEMVTTPGHLFYERLNTILNAESSISGSVPAAGSTTRAVRAALRSRRGRISGCCCLGYFEGIESERGVAWSAADSLSFRRFLGYELSELTPDHSM